MERRSPGPSLDYQDSVEWSHAYQYKASLFEASIAGLEQAHGVCDLQISS